MSKRFVVEYHESSYDSFNRIIDTRTGMVVGSDNSEPEDATLNRGFSWVCAALNAVSEGREFGYPPVDDVEEADDDLVDEDDE